METKPNTREISSKINLEARLVLMSSLAAVSGFVTFGVVDQASRGNYGEALALGILDIGNALWAYYHGIQAVEDYKSKK